MAFDATVKAQEVQRALDGALQAGELVLCIAYTESVFFVGSDITYIYLRRP